MLFLVWPCQWLAGPPRCLPGTCRLHWRPWSPRAGSAHCPDMTWIMGIQCWWPHHTMLVRLCLTSSTPLMSPPSLVHSTPGLGLPLTWHHHHLSSGHQTSGLTLHSRLTLAPLLTTISPVGGSGCTLGGTAQLEQLAEDMAPNIP